MSALFERAGNRSAAKRGEDILLVEDSIDDIELTTRAFAKAGITNSLHCVRDGEEALDYIFAAGPYMHRCYAPLPQVILLDLNLPKKSGVEVLKRLKTDRLTREIPVIVLTGSRRDRDIRECRRLGAANYLVKPVDFENFSRITRYLSLGWKLVNAEPSHMRT
ncbi:MAG: two-component system response regulator [Chthoniobacterales bacterium]|nr:MAG: two-component system response regulator [Chthoniobacterales bacterium]